MSDSRYYSLLAEVESDGTQSCKMAKTSRETFESSVSNAFRPNNKTNESSHSCHRSLRVEVESKEVFKNLSWTNNKNQWDKVTIIAYDLKLRVMVWRAARCLRPCDRLLIPPSVMLLQLITRANETSYSSPYSLLVESESDDMESCKISKALW